MSSFYIRKDGQIQKPADLICCKYRGAGVDCSKTDYADGKCKNCGWNPMVESKEKRKGVKTMYDKLVERLRNRRICIQQSGSLDDFPLLREAADAIEELQLYVDLYKDLTAKGEKVAREVIDKYPKWIPVTERLPEEDESVLVVRKFLGLKGQVPPSTYVEIAYRIGDGWVADSDEYKIARNRHTDPLYWIPLPQPPEESET